MRYAETEDSPRSLAALHRQYFTRDSLPELGKLGLTVVNRRALTAALAFAKLTNQMLVETFVTQCAVEALDVRALESPPGGKASSGDPVRRRSRPT